MKLTGVDLAAGALLLIMAAGAWIVYAAVVAVR